MTLYGEGAFLNGSIVAHGTLDVRELRMAGTIRFHGSRLRVESVRTTAAVAVVATSTTASIDISNTTGSGFIAAFANVVGDVAIRSCASESSKGDVVIQGSENDPQDWGVSTASWNGCVAVHNVGTLLNVFGKNYEVVFYSGDFFSETANLPSLITTYAAAIAAAGLAVAFLTHAGEMAHIAHVFAARRTKRADNDRKRL